MHAFEITTALPPRVSTGSCAECEPRTLRLGGDWLDGERECPTSSSTKEALTVDADLLPDRSPKASK